jgi:hypothetical protein
MKDLEDFRLEQEFTRRVAGMIARKSGVLVFPIILE